MAVMRHSGDDVTLKRFFAKVAELERAVAGFYRVLARRFAEDAAFWTAMADEEDEHAAWLDSALDVVETGQATPNPLRPMAFELDEGIAYVTGLQFKAADERNDASWALQAAKLIESSQLEKYYARHLVGVAPAMRDLFARLGTAEREHMARLTEFSKKRGTRP
jgi:rubrerythrin